MASQEQPRGEVLEHQLETLPLWAALARVPLAKDPIIQNYGSTALFTGTGHGAGCLLTVLQTGSEGMAEGRWRIGVPAVACVWLSLHRDELSPQPAPTSLRFPLLRVRTGGNKEKNGSRS